MIPTADEIKQMRIMLNVYEKLKYDPSILERMGITAKAFHNHRKNINEYLDGIEDEVKREMMRIILYTGMDTKTLLDYMVKADARKADASYQKEIIDFVDSELKNLGL